MEGIERQLRENNGYDEQQARDYPIFGGRPNVDLGTGPETKGGENLIFPTILPFIILEPVWFNSLGVDKFGVNVDVIRWWLLFADVGVTGQLTRWWFTLDFFEWLVVNGCDHCLMDLILMLKHVNGMSLAQL